MAKVDIASLPDNSYAARAKKPAEQKPEKSLEKVITGKVVQKKKPVGKRFMDRFFGNDIPDIKEYMIDEVMIPSVKNLLGGIVEGIGNGFMDSLNMAIFGTPRKSGQINRRPYTSYGGYFDSRYTSSRRDPREAQPQVLRSKRMFDDLIFETKSDAEQVLQGMFDALEMYGKVSVADLNSLVGVTGVWSDNDWGWKTLENSDIKRVREGHLLILPDVISLKE